MKVVLLDMGVGNLFNLIKTFTALGYAPVLANQASEIEKADFLVLPGVGAFKAGWENLQKNELCTAIVKHVERGRPLLGICLGMQLLMDVSYEHGCHSGFGLIRGEVQPLREYTQEKVPHVGWNRLELNAAPLVLKSQLKAIIQSQPWVYYSHSYFVATQNTVDAVGISYYGGVAITGMIFKNNICGCQFHPELSGQSGLNLITAIMRAYE